MEGCFTTYLRVLEELREVYALRLQRECLLSTLVCGPIQEASCDP